MGRSIRSAIAVLVIAQLSGCSFLFVKKAPSNVPQGAWADCTESRLSPVVDAIFGVSFVLSGVGISTTVGRESMSTEADRDAARIAGSIYALAGIGLLYASYVGFKETNRCGRIHDAYVPYPYPYPYPYPPPPQQPPPSGPPGSTPPSQP